MLAPGTAIGPYKILAPLGAGGGEGVRGEEPGEPSSVFLSPSSDPALEPRDPR